MTSLDNLVLKVKQLDAPSFLNDKIPEKEVETACVAFLKSLGYKVAHKKKPRLIKNLDELINFFYSLMDYYHNDVCALVANRQKDRTLFTRFINNRQEELKCSFEDGMQDCANIINALFVYEADLDLTLPIGTWVFGSDKCKWITDKVISMLNSNVEILNTYKMEKMVEADELRDKDYTGFNFDNLRRIHGD